MAPQQGCCRPLWLWTSAETTGKERPRSFVVAFGNPGRGGIDALHFSSIELETTQRERRRSRRFQSIELCRRYQHGILKPFDSSIYDDAASIAKRNFVQREKVPLNYWVLKTVQDAGPLLPSNDSDNFKMMNSMTFIPSVHCPVAAVQNAHLGLKVGLTHNSFGLEGNRSINFNFPSGCFSQFNCQSYRRIIAARQILIST